MAAIPITAMVIAAVEKMAKAQCVKTMKIVGRNNICILPTNWVAGVDYDDNVIDRDKNNYDDENKNIANDDTDEVDDNLETNPRRS